MCIYTTYMLHACATIHIPLIWRANVRERIGDMDQLVTFIWGINMHERSLLSSEGASSSFHLQVVQIGIFVEI